MNLNSRKALFALATFGVLAVSANAVNIVSNGSFETSDFSGWTLVGDPLNNFVDTGFSSDGTFAAWLGEVGGTGTLSQTIATVVGQAYTFSFDFAGDGDSPSSFAAAFGSNTVLSVVDPAFDLNYNTYSYSVTATSALTNVQFTFQDDAFYVNLDNVQVSAQAVPEPASFVALGMGAVALIRRRRKA